MWRISRPTSPSSTSSNQSIGWRWGISVFSVALLLRLLNLALIDDFAAHAIVSDARMYWEGAVNWIEQGFFSVPTEAGFVPETERVPLYHLFLIPFRLVFGEAVAPPLLVQCVVDAGTCLLIAKIASMIDRATGIVAGFFAATSFNMVLHTSLILAETLFLFLMAGLLLFAAKFVARCELRYAVIAGICCGLATITRPVALLLPLAMAAAVPFIVRYHGYGWRRGILAMSLVLISAVIPVSPLLYRNLTQFDTMQLTHQSGAHMLYWNVGTLKALESGRPFSFETQELNEKLQERIDRIVGPNKNLTAFEISNHQIAVARKELAAMPVRAVIYGWVYGAALNLASPTIALDSRIRRLNKSSFFYTKGKNVFEKVGNFLADNNPVYVAVLTSSIVARIVTLGLQAFGWVVMIRRLFWPAFFGTLFILYFLLINGPIGSPKYRLPFEPVLIIFQAYAVVNLIHRWRRLRRKSDPLFADHG